jgi:phosphatidate phosphatase PAH1
MSKRKAGRPKMTDLDLRKALASQRCMTLRERKKNQELTQLVEELKEQYEQTDGALEVTSSELDQCKEESAQLDRVRAGIVVLLALALVGGFAVGFSVASLTV